MNFDLGFCYIVFALFILCNSCNRYPQNYSQEPNGNTNHLIAKGSYITVKDFGAIGDGVTDDSEAIKKAIKSGTNPVVFPHGIYKISKPIELPIRTIITGNKSTLKYSGRDAAIKALVDSSTKISWDCDVSHLFIEISGNGAKAIDATNFQYSNFTGLGIKLKGRNTVGVYLKGNGKGTAPYYNSFSNLYIIGNNDPKKFPNQIGIKLDDAFGVNMRASGANANHFFNVKRIAGLAIAIDVVAGTGNIFDKIQTESIQKFHYRLNHRSADHQGKLNGITRRNSFSVSKTPKYPITGDLILKKGKEKKITAKIITARKGEVIIENSLTKDLKEYNDYEIYESKAVGNKFSNLRSEGTQESVFINLCYGAINNSFKNFEITSGSQVSIIRETNSLSNTVGDLTPFTFYAKDVKPNSKIELVPLNGPYGGIPIMTNCRVEGAHIKATKKSKGSCSLVLKRNSGLIELSPSLNNQNPFSNFETLKEYDSGSNARLRPGDGLQLELITDKNWTQNDITVTVWLAI